MYRRVLDAILDKLNREIKNINVIKLREVMLEDKSIYMIFEYAEHDFLVSLRLSIFSSLCEECALFTLKHSTRPPCSLPVLVPAADHSSSHLRPAFHDTTSNNQEPLVSAAQRRRILA